MEAIKSNVAAEVRITMTTTGHLHVAAPIDNPELCMSLMGQALHVVAQKCAETKIPLLGQGIVRPAR